jgi:NAD(P)-dependent dehydrogenase (short-subunit alcohol dehydrogenase family)
MFKIIVDKYGKVDVLVNNAGISRDALVLRMKPEQWQSVIDINLSGVYYCSQAFFKVRNNDNAEERDENSSCCWPVDVMNQISS